MALSNNQGAACMDPLPNQMLDLLISNHNCSCKNCDLQWFENEEKFPICRTKIRRKLLISGQEIHLKDIHQRSRSNTCAYLLSSWFSQAAISVDDSVDDDDTQHRSPSVKTFCSLCGCDMDLNWAFHHLSGCNVNNSVASAEYVPDNILKTAF